MDVVFYLLLTICFILIGVCILYIVGLIIGLFYPVPYVPSRTDKTQAMIKAAELKEGHHVLDLGCGDGKILFAAEKLHPKVTYTGYEVAPVPILLFLLLKTFKRSKAKLKVKDLMKADLTKCDVMFMYLLPKAMNKLLPKLEKELPKGCKVFSNTFTFKDKEAQGVIDSHEGKKLKTPVYIYQF